MKTSPPLESLILTVRGQRVILDADLAAVYGVPTKALNQAVKRNADRFPEDFCFLLDSSEWKDLKRSQSVTTSAQASENQPIDALKSQFVTSKRGGRRTCPYAFTEHGALMAANVLNSPEAVKMSVFVVRAFIKQRELLLAQADVLKRLAQMDAKLIQHDETLRTIWRELQPLLDPPPDPPKRQIGFHLQEAAPAYRTPTKRRGRA